MLLTYRTRIRVVGKTKTPQLACLNTGCLARDTWGQSAWVRTYDVPTHVQRKDGSVSEMSLNPLAQVKDYPSMLNRILLFTTVSASVATWLLRSHFQALDGLLSFLDINVDLKFVSEVKLLGYLLPGVVVAFIARTIRLHDRISDILRIRQRFDLHEVILPLARESGFPVGDLKMDELRAHRDV